LPAFSFAWRSVDEAGRGPGFIAAFLSERHPREGGDPGLHLGM